MNDRLATPVYRLETAAQLVQLPAARVRRYTRLGLVHPSRFDGRKAMFGEPQLARLRKIRRLSVDLGINEAGIEVVLQLIDQIEALQAMQRARDRR